MLVGLLPLESKQRHQSAAMCGTFAGELLVRRRTLLVQGVVLSPPLALHQRLLARLTSVSPHPFVCARASLLENVVGTIDRVGHYLVRVFLDVGASFGELIVGLLPFAGQALVRTITFRPRMFGWPAHPGLLPCIGADPPVGWPAFLPSQRRKC